MKRKALIAVLCMVMSVSIINTGCSGNTSKKEEKHTTETNNKGNKDTEEKTSEKSSEKTEKDTKKNVKYEYGITNLDSVEYVKDPSVPEVGEDGNPMNVPTDILGYYTNGTVGYDFRKIDGNFLVGDKIEFGYRTQSVSVNIMDVTTKGVTINFFADMDESKDILLTKDGFTIENTDEIEKSMLEWMDYCYYLMPMNRGYSEDRVADTFKKYQLGDYVRADYPETVYNLTYNEPELGDVGDMKLDEKVVDRLMEKRDKIEKTNTQPLTNRRDHDNYVKYIKYIPTDKYYIKGNPSKKEPLLIMRVSTGKEASHKMEWSAGDVNEGKEGTFDSTYAITEDERAQEEANQYWASGGTDNDEYVNGEYDIGINLYGFVNMGGKYITDGVYNSMIYVASLNYDVPELVGMTWDSDEALTEKEGTVTDKPYANYFKLDMSDIENGNITVNSNFYSETVIHKNEDKTDAVSLLTDRDMTQTLYSLSSGTEKRRLSGGMEVNESSRFRTALFLTSEKSILAQCNMNTGLLTRNFEFQNVTWTSSAESADRIKSVVTENYGHIIPRVAKWLLAQDRQKLVEKIVQETNAVIKRAREAKTYNNLTERTAKQSALILVAVDIVNEVLKLKLNKEAIGDFMEEHSLVNSVEQVSIGKRAMEWLLQFISKNYTQFLSKDSPKEISNCRGKLENMQTVLLNTDEESGMRLKVTESEFMKILKEGHFSEKATVLKEWKEMGYLKAQSDRYISRIKIVGDIQVKGYIIQLPVPSNKIGGDGVKDYEEVLEERRKRINKPRQVIKDEYVEDDFFSIDDDDNLDFPEDWK